jgi:hypothetical protein
MRSPGDDNEVIGPGMGGQPVILFQAVMDVGDDENFHVGVGEASRTLAGGSSKFNNGSSEIGAAVACYLINS